MSHNIYKLIKMDLHDKFIFFLGLILSLFSSGLTLLGVFFEIINT